MHEKILIDEGVSTLKKSFPKIEEYYKTKIFEEDDESVRSSISRTLNRETQRKNSALAKASEEKKRVNFTETVNTQRVVTVQTSQIQK